jgi:probable O-glycosylation ligase (exosortase A-associated)
VTAPLLVGAFFAMLRGSLHLDAVRNMRVLMLTGVVALCGVSLLFGPYASQDTQGIRNADYVFDIQLKLVLLLIVASLTASSERPLTVLAWMAVVSCTYLVYWANETYLSRGWVLRLGGPTDPSGTGPYADENNFGAFFVACLPFVWYLAKETHNKLLRVALLLIIPFGWHAIFLTGSRGALLGMAVVLIFIAARAGQRLYGALLILAFVLAFAYQAGDVMKDRAASIDDYNEDQSATGRLDSWKAAIGMMRAHPVTGVGPGAYVFAFRDFSDKQVLQAHNTYFQIGAEYGPLAAAFLLIAIALSISALHRRSKQLRLVRNEEKWKRLYAINEATLAGLVGIFVCSLFLTLQLFGILYFLLFMANSIDACIGRTLKSEPCPAQPSNSP